MSKGHWPNYAAVEEWLEANNIGYEKMSPYHYRIVGPAAVVDLWPGKMTVHVIMTESVDPNKYFKLHWQFNSEQLWRVLVGENPFKKRR